MTLTTLRRTQLRAVAHRGSVSPATPYLQMDLAAVGTAYRRLAAALPGVGVHFAMKCNPDPDVLTTLHHAGCGFEIASATELDALRAIGVPAHTVLFSNPVKPIDHVRRAGAAGVARFAVDSAAEIDKVAAAAPGARVYVRLAVAAGTSQVASEGKFGVDAEAAVGLLRRARRAGVEPYGLTFHVGSQMLDPGAWARAIATCGDIMRTLAADDIRLTLLDLGGGFPARYDAAVPPIEAYGAQIIAAANAHLPYPVALVVEPGRALVAEAGTMVAEVIGTAQRAGRTWVHLDVGAFNGLIEALETGNRLRFPVTDSRGARDKALVHLTGPSCDSQDTILYDVALSRGIRAGDQVFIGSAGAYTTAYASTFNGFAIPTTRCR